MATDKEIRAWAIANGFSVTDRGALSADVRRAYELLADKAPEIKPYGDDKHSYTVVKGCGPWDTVGII